MPCETPYFVNKKGVFAENGRGRLADIPVPCGKCPTCKRNRTSMWQFRLMQESKNSHSAYFVTFTYDTEYVPITPNGFMTLDKKEFPRYMKRLRKAHPKGTKIKYYAVGEYGSKRSRPHYHAIIFNADLSLIEPSWTVNGNPLGGVHIGSVTNDSVGYTAKYINKPSRIPLHASDDRIPEFSLMSKGLGKSYLSNDIINYHKRDLTRNYVTIDGGVKLPLPKYYRDKILTDQEKTKQLNIMRSILNDKEMDEYYRWALHYLDGDEVVGDYDRYKENAKRERYNRFYHYLNQKRE